MLVISRFRYADGADARAEEELGRCLELFGARIGFMAGSVGRALDDPTLWVLETRWENVGAYRRALSSYEMKMAAVPLLAQAIDEPSAYEVIIGPCATPPNEARPRGEEPGPGPGR